MGRARPVRVYDWRGNFIREFSSCTEANIFIAEGSGSSVVVLCQRQVSSLYGYVARYADDDDWFSKSRVDRVISYLNASDTRYRPVAKVLNDTVIAVYRTVVYAADANGFARRYFNMALNDRGGLIKGYVYRYASVDEIINYGVFIDERRHVRKPIRQYTTDGKFVAEFSSLKEAADKLGVDVTLISRVLYGRAKTCGGYVWGYATGNCVDIAKPNLVNANSLGVRLYDKSGVFVKEFSSVMECENAIGAYSGDVSRACTSKHLVKGWQVRYSSEKLDRLPAKLTRIVLQYTLDGKFVRSYKSCQEAAVALGYAKTSGCNIGDCCRGVRKTVFGYIWRYKNVL